MVRRYLGYAAAVALLLSVFAGATARAQSRIDDKDLARLMQNVKDDAQPFRKSFAARKTFRSLPESMTWYSIPQAKQSTWPPEKDS
jgi:hypothetical protein